MFAFKKIVFSLALVLSTMIQGNQSSFMNNAKTIATDNHQQLALKDFPMNIDHVIIPAAGYGTRFLPYTKATCKELVPLIDTPIIHHIVQEAILSGSSSIHIVINEHKQAIKRYFTHDAELMAMLTSIGREHLVGDLEQLIAAATFTFCEQREQHGAGHALLQAITQDMRSDFFGILYPDDIIFGEKPALAQLMDVARATKATVIAVTEVPDHKVSAYGIIQPKQWISEDLCEVEKIVEKPSLPNAPSRWAIIGRFVVSPGCIDSMNYCRQQYGDAFLFTDALEHLAKTEKVYAYRIQGRRHDTGTPEGWLESVIDYALHSLRYQGVVTHVPTLTDLTMNSHSACTDMYSR